MQRNPTQTLLAAGLALAAVAALNCTSQGGTPPPAGPQSVGSQGGTVTSGDATLVIPAGALAKDTAITVTKTDEQVAGADQRSPVYRFEPEGLAFEQPVTVKVRAPGLPAGASIFWTGLDGQTFIRLKTTLEGDVASAQITHFSRSYIGGTPDQYRDCGSARCDEGYYFSEIEKSKLCGSGPLGSYDPIVCTRFTGQPYTTCGSSCFAGFHSARLTLGVTCKSSADTDLKVERECERIAVPSYQTCDDTCAACYHRSGFPPSNACTGMGGPGAKTWATECYQDSREFDSCDRCPAGYDTSSSAILCNDAASPARPGLHCKVDPNGSPTCLPDAGVVDAGVDPCNGCRHPDGTCCCRSNGDCPTGRFCDATTGVCS